MLSQTCDVIVIGAGAAGLFCAIEASKRGRQVIVLDHANKAGKKILMSGGGRCNFTNLVVEAENFISANPHFCKAALKRYTQWDFIALVDKHNIEYEERKHGQLFCQHSARDIVDMLLDECEAAGVEIRTRCEIDQLQQREHPDPAAESRPASSYRLTVKDGPTRSSLECASLVVATGALPKDGYQQDDDAKSTQKVCAAPPKQNAVGNQYRVFQVGQDRSPGCAKARLRFEQGVGD